MRILPFVVAAMIVGCSGGSSLTQVPRSPVGDAATESPCPVGQASEAIGIFSEHCVREIIGNLVVPSAAPGYQRPLYAITTPAKLTEVSVLFGSPDGSKPTLKLIIGINPLVRRVLLPDTPVTVGGVHAQIGTDAESRVMFWTDAERNYYELAATNSGLGRDVLDAALVEMATAMFGEKR